VALGISHSGQTRETIEMLAEAGSRGVTTIALTSFPGSPLAAFADIVLLTATQATTFRPDALSARHPQLVVLDLLYISVAQRTYERAHAAFKVTAQAVAGHRSPTPREAAP
jgi:DNA-binding MurR/RpiR family transcriptional regulator